MPNPNRPQPNPNSKRSKRRQARLAKQLTPGQRGYHGVWAPEAWEPKLREGEAPYQAPRPELAPVEVDGDWLLADARLGDEWFGETDSLVYEGPYRNNRRVRGHGWMKGKNSQVVSFVVCDACREARRTGCAACRPSSPSPDA